MADMKNLLELDFEHLQTFMSLRGWKVDEVKNLSGTENRCIKNNDTEISFLTMIPVGASFPLHWHDVTEKVTVISGVFADEIFGALLKKGETLTYPPYTKHLPRNGGDQPLHIRVDFKK